MVDRLDQNVSENTDAAKIGVDISDTTQKEIEKNAEIQTDKNSLRYLAFSLVQEHPEVADSVKQIVGAEGMHTLENLHDVAHMESQLRTLSENTQQEKQHIPENSEESTSVRTSRIATKITHISTAFVERKMGPAGQSPEASQGYADAYQKSALDTFTAFTRMQSLGGPFTRLANIVLDKQEQDVDQILTG